MAVRRKRFSCIHHKLTTLSDMYCLTAYDFCFRDWCNKAKLWLTTNGIISRIYQCLIKFTNYVSFNIFLWIVNVFEKYTLEKTEGPQSGMENPETQSTLGTRHGRTKTNKAKKNPPNNENWKDEQNGPHKKRRYK
jgi:hypothetical protein